MTVQELVEQLAALPQDATVTAYDSEYYTDYGVDRIEHEVDPNRHTPSRVVLYSGSAV